MKMAEKPSGSSSSSSRRIRGVTRAIDLSGALVPSPKLDRAALREKIDLIFSTVAEEAAGEVIEIMRTGEKEDTRLRAANRVLTQFSPTQATVQGLGGVSIQILNHMPIPEFAAINGKQVPEVSIAGVKMSLPALPPARPPKVIRPVEGSRVTTVQMAVVPEPRHIELPRSQEPKRPNFPHPAEARPVSRIITPPPAEIEFSK